jgi:large subunit ribosomal protein L1
MASKRNVNMSDNTDEIKILGQEQTDADGSPIESTEDAGDAATQPAAKKSVKKNARSKRYQKNRSQVDKTKQYDTFAAVELVKRLSYSTFPGTLVADVVTKEIGEQANLTFPHSTGKSLRVAIMSDELLATIESGVIEFDVLLSNPSFMPKLAKLARVLGPRGLMPNPKNGTLTAKPELKKKELEKGTFAVKTERKQPVAHIVIGKQDMETKDLVENLNALLKSLKGKANKVVLSATMSPGIKVQVVTV